MHLSSRSTTILILSYTVVGLVTLVMTDAIAQDPEYHAFADQRIFISIPHAFDVLSNIPFLVVGLVGLSYAAKARQDPACFEQPWEWYGFTLLCAGIALVSLGSGYYHWDPNNSSLVWDRLPMTIGFTTLFALQIGERLSMTAGKRLLPVLVILGLASVVYWDWTEQQGQGDLRFYAMVQFLPLVTILLLLWVRPPRYTHGSYLVIALGFYAGAKLLEVLDDTIFGVGHFISGHTLKHLAAGLAVWFIINMFRKRKRIESA